MHLPVVGEVKALILKWYIRQITIIRQATIEETKAKVATSSITFIRTEQVQTMPSRDFCF